MPGNAADLLRGKQSRVLNIGRFSPNGHCKRQHLLIQAFATLCRQTAQEVDLHLVGTIYPEHSCLQFYGRCHDLAAGERVVFHPNAEAETVNALCRQAAIYWHGTGLRMDADEHPERMEHFGIAVTEAMSAGCIPVVYHQGGPAEIVQHNRTGYLFSAEAELVEITLRLLDNKDTAATQAMRVAAMARASEFSGEVFRRQWRELLS